MGPSERLMEYETNLENRNPAELPCSNGHHGLE